MENQQRDEMSYQDATEKTRLFFQLLMAHQPRIYKYILMLMLNAADADDIMQDTVAVMWQNFDQFVPGSSFAAWGVQIARNKVLNFRRSHRHTRIQLNDELFEKILSTAPQASEMPEEFIKAVKGCLGKLSDRDRLVMKMKYEENLSTKMMADRMGRSLNGLYKSMARIHDLLYQCVNRVVGR